MECQSLLHHLVSGAKECLGGRLTGVYLHGSLAMGCFNPQKSDIDLILVSSRSLTLSEKRRLIKLIAALNAAAPAKGIEISAVRRAVCRPFQYPTPYELHFSPMHLKRYLMDPEKFIREMNGVDYDLAAHFTMLLARGAVLWGSPIGEVFGSVPPADYLDSILKDASSALQDVLENPVYVLLNLLRTLAYMNEKKPLSKKEGGEWGLKNLCGREQRLIQTALDCYGSDRVFPIGEMREDALDFCRNMLAAIEKRQSPSVF